MKKEYMDIAFEEAKIAFDNDEVPIGVVIVKDDKIIAKAHNNKNSDNLVTSHAEIIAIEQAERQLNNWRLDGCDIYITLEPCIMCSGAIIQSRIKTIYYGAYDEKGGALGTSIDVLTAENINHHPEVHGGIMKEECSTLLTNYFKKKRKMKLGL